MLWMSQIIDNLGPMGTGPAVKTGQNNMSTRKAGDTGDQVTRRGKCAGRSSHNNQTLWRRCLPRGNTCPRQQFAPDSKIDNPLTRQNIRPPVNQQVQQNHDILPMLGETIRQHVTQLTKVRANCRHLIKQIPKRTCQHHCPAKGRTLATKGKPLQQPRKHHLATKLVDGWRNINNAITAQFQLEQSWIILIHITDRQHPWQQHRLLFIHL